MKSVDLTPIFDPNILTPILLPLRGEEDNDG